MVEEANIEDEEQQSDDVLGEQEQQSNLRSEEVSSKHKRKSRGDPFLDGLTSAVAVLGDKLEQASNTMVKVELDIHKKTSMLSSELEKIASLSYVERYKAFEKITQKQDRVLYFWSLEGDAREDLVRLLLEEPN